MAIVWRTAARLPVGWVDWVLLCVLAGLIATVIRAVGSVVQPRSRLET